MNANKTYQESSLTVTHLMELADETIRLGQQYMSRGEKWITSGYAMPSYRSPMLAQLSSLVGQATVARLALQSWMEKTGSESGPILVKKLSQHSHGWWACFRLIEICQMLSWHCGLLDMCH